MTTTTAEVTYLPDGRMDTRNAAIYLGLSDKTLAMKRCDGTGPEYVKVGGLVFYFKNGLDSFIASGKRCSTHQMAENQLAS